VNVFAKIFAQIFDSSIAADHVVRHVFMDLIVLADRDGVVDMTLDAISRRTNVPEDIVAHAIAELMKPDKKSRSHEESGKRLVPLDSHRDWGWQIVNFEHYRAIRDEESRKTYFRDYKRQYRKSKAPAISPQLSTNVLDRPTLSTKGEGEGEEEGDTEGKPLPPPLKMPTDSGSELMAANWLLEELCIPADNGTRKVAADSIRLLAKEGGTVETAMLYIFEAGKQAIAGGETINRFWFSDQKYRPQAPIKSRRQKEKDAKLKEFMEAASDD
jgi:hypothetical protein